MLWLLFSSCRALYVTSNLVLPVHLFLWGSIWTIYLWRIFIIWMHSMILINWHFFALHLRFLIIIFVYLHTLIDHFLIRNDFFALILILITKCQIAIIAKFGTFLTIIYPSTNGSRFYVTLIASLKLTSLYIHHIFVYFFIFIYYFFIIIVSLKVKIFVNLKAKYNR